MGLIVIALASSAQAGPVASGGEDEADEEDGRELDQLDGLHLPEATAWVALELAIPAWYYWSTREEQEVDWTNPSWTDKLTLRSVRFDTNAFKFNAVRHPLAGLGDYQFARSNGFGMLGSTLVAFFAGAFWEFAVEYNEDPSLNDLIMNAVGGISLGEPLYQIGQLWRGGQLSIADRLRTAAFSPFAATQDLWRQHRSWHRRSAWSDFAFTAGPKRYYPEGGDGRSELELGADVDVVRHRGFVTARPGKTTVVPGAWSRVEVGARFGDLGEGARLVATSVRTRTSITGSYRQDAGGDGALFALGTAFTYHRDRLAEEWDHAAFGHLIGPQVQLSRRTDALALRWDVAGYVDFGLIDAHVFGPVSPLPRPPPYLSTLQVEGYYPGGGGTIETRVRADAGVWHAELELAAHRLWSLDFADRVKQVPDVSRIDPDAQDAVIDPIPPAPHGVSDVRVYGHAQVGVRAGAWGLAATADATYRRGVWRELERVTADWRLGVVATVNL